MNRASMIFVCAGLALAAAVQCVQAQEDFGVRLGVRRGGAVYYEPTGPGVLFDALDPAVKKWYVPQELFTEYQWRQQDYTNYARPGRNYQRYVNTAIDGEYFYDLYGDFLTRGQLVYDWRVDSPQTGGSNLTQTNFFQQWFNNVAIASDSKGQYHYAITFGTQIRTTLTPMTFSKAQFNGIQFDVATDKYEATFMVSRPSSPGVISSITQGTMGTAGERSNDTNVIGGRATAQLGDFVKVGGTYVSAFNAQTKGQAFQGNPFKGTLTEGQNKADITRLEVRLSDDSPEDGEGGAAFFQEEMIITTTDGKRTSNRRRLDDNNILDFEPTIQGGFRREGFLAADGNEVITLVYDLTGPQYINAFGPPPERIRKIEFVLLLANDYRIDVTSDRQLNSNGQPVLLSEGIPEYTIRAEDNVKDGSNQRFVRVKYGLPVANEIFGFTFDLTDVGGFFLQSEFDRNRRHFRYPRRAENDAVDNAASKRTADAWFVNLYKRQYPYFLFGEAYSVDEDYSTSAFLAGIADDSGDIFYDDNRQFVYEFVDDNDDQDRTSDWSRRNEFFDSRVFPGFDENNDFINDFNQNDTQLRQNSDPDWEEPFLRYNADRPEFLFGIDMNNNTVIDRLENDELADLLYKRDRQGYNIYVGTHLSPNIRLTLGRLDEGQIADNRDNTINYALLTFDRNFPRLGRVQVFNHFRRVKDNIRDDVIEWVVRPGSRGDFVPLDDQLPFRKAWANTLYVGYNFESDRIRFRNRLKYEFVHQIDFDKRPLEQRNIRETASFFGMINKFDYTYNLGILVVQPRIKSEIQRNRPALRTDTPVRVATTELSELLSLIVRLPLLNNTTIQTGFELLFVNQFRDQLKDDLIRSDRNEVVVGFQLLNNVSYLGYNLFTETGLRVSRIDIDAADKTRTETRLFATVYAGLDN